MPYSRPKHLVKGQPSTCLLSTSSWQLVVMNFGMFFWGRIRVLGCVGCRIHGFVSWHSTVHSFPLQRARCHVARVSPFLACPNCAKPYLNDPKMCRIMVFASISNPSKPLFYTLLGGQVNLQPDTLMRSGDSLGSASSGSQQVPKCGSFQTSTDPKEPKP